MWHRYRKRTLRLLKRQRLWLTWHLQLNRQQRLLLTWHLQLNRQQRLLLTWHLQHPPPMSMLHLPQSLSLALLCLRQARRQWQWLQRRLPQNQHLLLSRRPT
jgi:hypothetical protein